MRFVSKNRILWALTVLRILQVLVILNITCFFPRVLSHLACAKSCARGCELFHTDNRDFPFCFSWFYLGPDFSPSAFQGCTWAHGTLPGLSVPLCASHSLSEMSGQFLFPFFLPQAKHREGEGLWPRGILILSAFQREQMAMAHEHFRHRYRRGWAHLKETEKPICPTIQTMSLSSADTARPHRCRQPGQ